MSFTSYERHHLHDYVYNKNDPYNKNEINNKLASIQNSITTSINNLKIEITAQLQLHEAKILTQMLNFRNEQIKNRIQRKYLKIP